jgi:hypothetical protein
MSLKGGQPVLKIFPKSKAEELGVLLVRFALRTRTNCKVLMEHSCRGENMWSDDDFHSHGEILAAFVSSVLFSMQTHQGKSSHANFVPPHANCIYDNPTVHALTLTACYLSAIRSLSFSLCAVLHLKSAFT